MILAGGAGTRLRPLSSDDEPKQFLKLFDGESLLQRTFARARRGLPAESIFVSTNERYREKVLEHLPEFPPENVIAEPARRNTAPAIALTVFTIEQRVGPCVIASLHSDHYMANEDAFLALLDRAYAFAESTDYIVTIGVHPDEPSTEYGYLRLGDELAPGVIRLERFVEKPDRETAQTFLDAGNYAWNAGIFVWRSDVFRRELEAAAPEVARVTAANYESMPSISIDYALMEKAPRVATISGDFGWSDVGSFEALRRVGVKLPDGIEVRGSSEREE
jgi:mannose-1-phosphate guanylyltransferase